MQPFSSELAAQRLRERERRAHEVRYARALRSARARDRNDARPGWRARLRARLAQ